PTIQQTPVRLPAMEGHLEGKELLRELSEAAGISGREEAAREKMIRALESLVDRVQVDAMGNVVALKQGEASKRGEKPNRLLFTAHTDEIGLVVSGFWEGFLRIQTVGGIDRRVLLGQEVVVHGSQELTGVIGLRPPHLHHRQEEIPRLQDLLVDVGFSNEEEVRARVRVGDPISLKASFVELLNDRVAGKAFDDRACVAAIIEAFRILQGQRHEWDIIFLGAVQEEIGHKGAITGGYAIFPDLAVALDVGFGMQPGVSKEKGFPLGKGPTLAIGPHFHTPLVQALKEIAQKWNIAYQEEVMTSSGGTDAWALQVVRSGVPTALLSLPIQSMHTVVETLHWRDVETTARWLALFAASLTAESKEKLAIHLPGGGSSE
ncbi:MAG TPA: M42 family peptidase, partial [Anaerolineae bacterium]|nr:M42 family peptidase [Anaerolineae bacterium]